MKNERYELAAERIYGMKTEELVQEPFLAYFRSVADFALLLVETLQTVQEGRLREMDLASLQELNRKLYSDILPAHYEESYANPAYIAKQFATAGIDAAYAPVLCFLYAELRCVIPYVFEQDLATVTLYLELFLQVYGLFVCKDTELAGELPDAEEIRDAIYWFESDNCDVMLPKRLDEQLDPESVFAKQIISGSDLGDVRYLYTYGDYVSKNELGLARLFAGMDEAEVERLAFVYTEGYRLGFVNNDKDLSKKETAEVIYPLGLERMVKAAIPQFAAMGLKVTIRRDAPFSLYRRGYRSGCVSTSPNRQYDFDHKEDEALFLDKDFVNRKVSVLKAAFEERKDIAKLHAGPAVIETFGEEPFDPVFKKEALHLSKKQQKLSVEFAEASGRLNNEYIIGEERSFTIISFPCPAIGERFPEIFKSTVQVNTLDYKRYEKMQQILIDILDQAGQVHIKGRGKNQTDITVALYEMQDPAHETIFENCVADVNIPVGEVFTSPKLTGTNGVLHVPAVYLQGLKYVDLRITFENGRISDYTCGNFDSEEENRKYIRDNILFHHETLPIGEFAIGTNTTAYAMAVTYDIQDRLDILIAEKTGPHFAVGDTCYSYDEDLITRNPDGKRIVARDNEITIKRKENPSEAYFHCHTDITIPYDELAFITAIGKDGTKTDLIRDGLFVPEGLEELNVPLLALWKKNEKQD